MIAGLETISSGELYIGDRLVNDVPPNERDIAMVFQSYALYPHMSVRENLAFALTLRRFQKTEIARRVTEVSRMLGLEGLLDRKPRQLSGGQRQRVALGRAIVREPQVFLFDEPLSNLDAALRSQTRRDIARLHQRLGATMVYVTHDQVEAMTLGDRIVVMHLGRVMQTGTPLEVYERPANRFVAGFIGSPAMTFLTGRVDAAGAAIVGGADGAPRLPVPNEARGVLGHEGRGVELGVRPEHVVVVPRPGEVDDAWARFTLPVELVESVGNEALVYLTLGGGQLVARTAPHRAPRAGETVEVAIDMRRAHYFDAGSGERLPDAVAAGAAT
jgi:multiple sugar transport system ATP-binding protein